MRNHQGVVVEADIGDDVKEMLYFKIVFLNIFYENIDFISVLQTNVKICNICSELSDDGYFYNNNRDDAHTKVYSFSGCPLLLGPSCHAVGAASQ